MQVPLTKLVCSRCGAGCWMQEMWRGAKGGGSHGGRVGVLQAGGPQLCPKGRQVRALGHSMARGSRTQRVPWMV